MNSKEIKIRAINKIRILLITTCIITGLIAGTSIEKHLIRIPAWRKMDITYWSEFSQYEYLGFGFYFYLAKSIACLVLFSIILFWAIKYKVTSIRLGVAVLLVLMTISLSFTLLIAPLMFSLPDLGHNLEALKALFEEVNYWGFYRMIVQLFTFIFCVFVTGKSFTLTFFNS